MITELHSCVQSHASGNNLDEIELLSQRFRRWAGRLRLSRKRRSQSVPDIHSRLITVVWFVSVGVKKSYGVWVQCILFQADIYTRLDLGWTMSCS